MSDMTFMADSPRSCPPNQISWGWIVDTMETSALLMISKLILSPAASVRMPRLTSSDVVNVVTLNSAFLVAILPPMVVVGTSLKVRVLLLPWL